MKTLPNLNRLLSRSLIITVSILLSIITHAQNTPDELRAKLKNTKELERANILLDIAYYYGKNTADSAEWYANQVFLLNQKLNNKLIEAKWLLLQSEIFYFKDLYDSSIVYAERSMRISTSMGEENLLAGGYNLMGENYLRIGSYTKADSCFQIAMKIFEKENNQKSLYRSLNSLGNVYYKQGMLQAALKTWEKGFEVATKINDTTRIAAALSNIANVNASTGNYKAAVESWNKSLEMSRKLNDTRAMFPMLLNLGLAYLNWDKYDEALIYMNEALLLNDELKIPRYAALLRLDIGDVYCKKKEFLKSVENLEIALTITKDIKNPHIEAIVLNSLNVSYRGLNEYKRAIEYGKQSLSIRQELGNSHGIAESYSAMGVTYSEWGKSAEAIRCLEKSNEIASELNLIETAMVNHDWLSKEYEKQNNISKAYQHFKEYKTLEDSIFSEESNEQLSELQLKYETEKKENEILRLNKKNATQELELTQTRFRNRLYLMVGTSLLLFLLLTLIFYRNILQKRELLKKQNKELEELNKTKNHFFSVVAHDLKSHITAFQSAGKIVEHHIAQKKYDTAIQFANHIETESEKLNNMLNNLLKWSITQLHGYNIRPEKLMVKSEVETILETFNNAATSKNIVLVNNIEPELVAWADKGSFHVVLRNLISNAIKYSSNGKVDLTAKTSNGFLNINVEDCGKGIPPEIEKELFNIGEEKIVKGTDGERGTGLGLLLVKQFTEMNMGKIGFRNSERGALFTVSLPIS